MATKIEKILQEIKMLSRVERIQLQAAIDRDVVESQCENELSEDEFEQQLMADGFLHNASGVSSDVTAYKNRVPITVKGKPLSETVIEDRR